LDRQVSEGSSRTRNDVVRPSTPGPHTVTETLLALQRTHGNAFVRRLVQREPVVSRAGNGDGRTSTTPGGSGRTPRDLKKILKDPCFGELVDDSRAQCQFSSEQAIMIRVVKESALRACASAMAAINMPGNEARVKQIARDYFHVDLLLTEKTRRALIKTIRSISDQLANAAIECRSCHDENCNRGLIAFVEGRAILALCPPFFESEIHKVYKTPRYLTHEAGHLAGVNTPTRDEMYCDQGATKDDKCPVIDALHNADAWSHFIEDVASSI